MNERLLRIVGVALLAGGLGFPARAQQAVPSPTAKEFTLPAASATVPAETLLDPQAAAWQQFAARRVTLNRTPPLYDTDPLSELEIPALEVRAARADGKLLLLLSWSDATDNSGTVPAAPTTPPDQRVHKELTPATERFFDAAAVMYPANLSKDALTPSLQMGDASHPVTIYYWNAGRGAMLMDAQGRGTTHRTADSFPARSLYRRGTRLVTLELPALPAGIPLAFAVWNGGQQDRDGRKYFSVWYWLE